MTLLAATQIPKPADEQAFERASVVLWCGLLGDPTVQRNGRRGQGQNGVDLFGIRDGKPDWHVGIQCKLKSEGHFLSENEVRTEVKKALTFKPPLREYFIVTTAPDDVAMQELARVITAELFQEGYNLRVLIWGWNTLEEKISEDATALKAFDPSYGPFGQELLAETRSFSSNQREANVEVMSLLSSMDSRLAEISSRLPISPGDATTASGALEAHLDSQIDEYRDLNTSGRTLTALPLLEKLFERVRQSASGRILYRIEANIGHCLVALGQDREAVDRLLAAYDNAPKETTAIANKAFAMLLRGDWEELLRFGMEALSADPTNEGLAGYIIQAARYDTSITTPLDLVPEQLRATASVMLANMYFLRHRGQPGEWWSLAREALAAHPSDQFISQFGAEAELEQVLSDGTFLRTRLLSTHQRGQLELATQTLKSLWDEKRKSDGPLRSEDAALCGNATAGLYALGDLQGAREVVSQGLERISEDLDLAMRGLVVALEADDRSLADRLITKLPPDSADATLTRFRYYASRRDWHGIARLYREEGPFIPASEIPMIRAAAEVAAIKIGNDSREQKEQRASGIAQEASKDARASIVIAEYALGEGFNDIADQAFRSAMSNLSTDCNVADRLMVAHYATRLGRPKIVADLLDGHVPETRDSEALQSLACAMVNDFPVRDRALAFFKRLPSDVHELPFFLHAEGLLHFNRGALAEAEVALKKAIAVQPDLDCYLALFSTLVRLDRDDELKSIVPTIDLEKIRGTPAQKMHLAQIVRKFGDGQKAIAFAYNVQKSARNDQSAALGYFGLIMMDPSEDLIPSSPNVAVDTWVRLQDEFGEQHAFLIEAGKDRPADDVLSPTHPTAAAAMGLKLGEEFDMPAGLGERRKWRIEEIKHKYLYALHDVMDNFEKRFPDGKGIYKFTTKEGDVQPILDQVRKAAEQARAQADLYLKDNCPLSFVARTQQGQSIQFAEYIRSLDFDIRTCAGTDVERANARQIIEKYAGKGAVLDTYTAWTVASIEGFDILEAVFGSLIVPQVVIDELRSLRDERAQTIDGSMTLTWHDGKFIRQEHTAQDAAAAREFIDSRIIGIDANCEVKPVGVANETSELITKVYRVFGSHAIDPLHLARGERVLLSEDMNLRLLAEAASLADGVWLQSVFSYALERGLIDRARYVSLVIKLAWCRHGHLALEAATLLAVLETDSSEKLDNFSAVANFIGSRNADITSHIKVSIEFLTDLWGKYGDVDFRCMKATGILLDRLLRFRPDVWPFILALLKRGCHQAVRNYVDQWITGHFLDPAKVMLASVEIERRLSQAKVNRKPREMSTRDKQRRQPRKAKSRQ